MYHCFEDKHWPKHGFVNFVPSLRLTIREKMRKPWKKMVESLTKATHIHIFGFNFSSKKLDTPKALIEKFIFEAQNDSQSTPLGFRV
jgi:hypothetical protein